MRRFFQYFIAAAFLASCSNTEKKEEKQTTGNDITTSEVYQEGLALVAQNKCMTCHQISEPLTGPPYREVANKYDGYPDSIVSHLAQRVIKGGKGVWGEVYMIPHPTLSQEDAEKMVRYILLLKNKNN